MKNLGRFMTSVSLVATVGAGAILIGCGGVNTEAYAADYRLCSEQFSELRADMKKLDSRLDSGLTYRDYERDVENFVADHSKVDMAEIEASFDTLKAANPDASRDNACIGTAEELETAYEAYSSAKATWSDCVNDITVPRCTDDAATSTELQSQWETASTALDDADKKWVAMKALSEGREPPAAPDANQEGT